MVIPGSLGRPTAIGQLYNKGSICELINSPRKTLVGVGPFCLTDPKHLIFSSCVGGQVRFECAPEAATHLKEIREVSTCAYEAIVQTPAVCEHPLLKVRQGFVSCSCSRGGHLVLL